ncbi:MAG: hypothetical protein ACR2O6_15880 [Ilumatobacteraceae bacterium]
MTVVSPVTPEVGASDALDRVALEVELLAPPGVGRADLGSAIAAAGARPGASAPVFAFGLEPVPRRADITYHHLSRGVAVTDGDGRSLCRIVDDFSISRGWAPRSVARVTTAS